MAKESVENSSLAVNKPGKSWLVRAPTGAEKNAHNYYINRGCGSHANNGQQIDNEIT